MQNMKNRFVWGEGICNLHRITQNPVHDHRAMYRLSTIPMAFCIITVPNMEYAIGHKGRTVYFVFVRAQNSNSNRISRTSNAHRILTSKRIRKVCRRNEKLCRGKFFNRQRQHRMTRIPNSDEKGHSQPHAIRESDSIYFIPLLLIQHPIRSKHNSIQNGFER